LLVSVPYTDFRQALGLVSIWQDAATVDQLAGATVAAFRELVDCEGVTWNELALVEHAALRVVTDPSDHFRVPTAWLRAHVHEHPIVADTLRTGAVHARTISDFLTVEQFHASELYGAFFRPLGVEDQLAFVVSREKWLVWVAFHRSSRTFTEHDRAVLDLLQPHLATAYRRLMAEAETSRRVRALEGALATQGLAIVFVSRTGRVVDASGFACDVLERWFSGVPRELRLGTYHQPGALLHIRPASTDGCLLLEEQLILGAAKAARRVGLTRREAEVLELAGQGLGDVEIASCLVISVRTVQKHLEHAYRKLHVHSRHAASFMLHKRRYEVSDGARPASRPGVVPPGGSAASTLVRASR
jgi:DNA-binding CsgD family transcriptional regulator